MTTAILDALIEYIDARINWEVAKSAPIAPYSEYKKRTRETLADRLTHLKRLVKEEEESK